MRVETILLKIAGDSGGAEQVLRRVGRAIDELGATSKKAQGDVAGTGSGLKNALGVFKQFYQNASQGQQGLAGLANVIGSINPVAGMALNGILGLGRALSGLRAEAIAVISNAQGLEIALQSLAARELVKTGQFENATAAMDTAKVAAAGLLDQLQRLGLQSPFQNSLVVESFKLAMGYGFASDQAMRLTEANLNVAAGMSLTGADMAEVSRVFGQIRSTGKLLTQDLNQLRARGIDLAGMLRDDLGVSVEQFNAGLAAGTYSMDDLLDVYTRFASTNFGGAAERMSKTITGLKSSLEDLKEAAYIKLLKPALDQLTGAAAEGFGWLSDLVMQSGALEKAGAALSTLVGKAIDAGKAFLDWLKPGLDVVNRIEVHKTLRDLSTWFGLITADVRETGRAIWAHIQPALAWLSAA
ncbi:MAG: hypothetical protein JXA21_12315, partial [Anaerolineae bacterium]|nr:hypothetical protein [Anaerolineae bacterium]